MKGEIAAGGADWKTTEQGVIRLDGKYILKTDDGAVFSMHMKGWEIDSAVKAHLFFTTGDERYTWLNTAVAVGVLGIGPQGRICYDAYTLA